MIAIDDKDSITPMSSPDNGCVYRPGLAEVPSRESASSREGNMPGQRRP
jgi:hypothetical protein